MFWFFIDPAQLLFQALARILHYPFLACGVCLLIFFSARLLKNHPRGTGVFFKTVSGIGALLLFLCFSYATIMYLLFPGFIDHLEPQIAVVAQILSQGKPVYHSFDNAERYMEMYGPMAYVVNMLFQKIGNDIIFSSKLAGIFLSMAALIIIYATFRKRAGLYVTGLIIGFMVMCNLWFGHYAYWNKPDPLLVFCCSIACWAVFVPRISIAVAVLSIATALSVNVKPHAVLYLLPFFVFFLIERGRKPFLLCLCISLPLFTIPFWFCNSISFHHYFQGLRAVSRHPIYFPLVLLNLKYVLLLFLPIVGACHIAINAHSRTYTARDKQSLLILWSAVFAMIIVSVIGAKIGSGPHHLLPFSPCVAFLIYLASFSDFTEHQKGSGKRYVTFIVPLLCTLWLLTACLTAIKSQKLIFPFFNKIDQHAVVRYDLTQLMKKYHGFSIQMGYGGDSFDGYKATWFRPLLYESKNDYLLDAPAIMDMKMSGIGIPPATCAAIKEQKYDLWFTPANEIPFTMKTWYPPHGSLFGLDFSELFQENYQLIETSDYFSVWMSKKLLLRFPAGRTISMLGYSCSK